eukprot:TRINITY_DN3653_c0_g1_i1.p1 TRINITY_DN3653_c0_g1~~TRINITY_DN3653_c0_g1_i1.p1  ORF type:complete len:108 (-),score=20.80 TRINITY_DN3653_c0_g1_i1:88-411(-)
MRDFPPKVIESVFNAITEKVERGKDQIKVRTHFVSELQEIVTPERAAMYECMSAAIQRMKDKGISEELLKACRRHTTGKYIFLANWSMHGNKLKMMKLVKFPKLLAS